MTAETIVRRRPPPINWPMSISCVRFGSTTNQIAPVVVTLPLRRSRHGD